MRYKDGTFERVGGRAKDISVGSDGSIYAVGWNKMKKGYGIWKYNGKEFKRTSGFGYRIAVDNEGFPWVVTKRHQIFRKTKLGWKRIRGSLDDIAIGPEGSVLGVRRRRGVWKYNLDVNKWFKIGKNALNIAVGPGGKPYATTSKGEIFWADSECPSNNQIVSKQNLGKQPQNIEIDDSEEDSDHSDHNTDMHFDDDIEDIDDLVDREVKGIDENLSQEDILK